MCSGRVRVGALVSHGRSGDIDVVLVLLLASLTSALLLGTIGRWARIKSHGYQETVTTITVIGSDSRVAVSAICSRGKVKAVFGRISSCTLRRARGLGTAPRRRLVVSVASARPRRQLRGPVGVNAVVGEGIVRNRTRWEGWKRLFWHHGCLFFLSSFGCCGRFGFLPSPSHQSLIAVHAENALRSPRITKVFDLALAVSAAETCRAEGLVTCQDGQVLDFVATRSAAVRAVIADKGAIAEQEKVGIGVEKRAARGAAKAVEMPSVAS